MPLPSGEPHIDSICCADPSDTPNFAAGFGTAYDVFYVFNSEDFDTFTFNLTNISGSVIGLMIYTGSCDNLSERAGCLVPDVCEGNMVDFFPITPNTDYYFSVFTTDMFGCGNYTLTCIGYYSGCTDVQADNYDPDVSIDDGSCIYSSPPPNDLCGAAIPLVCNATLIGSTGGSSATGAPLGLICDANPGAGVWYSLSPTSELISISTCGSVIDSKINVWSAPDCAGPFECVEQVDGSYASESVDSQFLCGFNDQENATVSFAGDGVSNYWVYISSEDADNDPLTDDNGSFVLGVSCEEAVEGCTIPVAYNYNPLANINDGSCDFFSDTCQEGSGTPVQINMYDTFGNGWNIGGYELTDGSGNVIASNTIDNALYVVDENYVQGAEFGFDLLCLQDGCYTISVTGSYSAMQNSINIIDEFGTSIAAEGTPEDGNTLGDFSISFTIGDLACGCTDAVACNFNSTATDEDNSCEYLTCAGCIDPSACNYDTGATIENGTCCFENCISINMSDSAGNGWNGGGYEIFNDDNELIANGNLNTAQTGNVFYTGTDALCLADDCYSIVLTGGSFPSQISWELVGVNGGTITGGAPIEALETIFTVGVSVCEYMGCTDPIACNYVPNANADDGSCEYPFQYYIPADYSSSETAPMLLICEGDEPNTYELANQNCAETVLQTYPECLESDWDLACAMMYYCCTEGEVGCHDPLACNFDPLTCPDGDCFYALGCTDPDASNFDPAAECNAGCVYSFNGIVFNDLNSNGFQDVGDLGLANETVTVNGGQYVAITDDFGAFELDVVSGGYSFQGIPNLAFPTITTGGQQFFSTANYSNELIAIGKSFENFVYTINIDVYPNGFGLVCDQDNTFDIAYRNMSNVPISGYMTFEFDDLISEASLISPVDSIVDGIYYYGFENLWPNQLEFKQINLPGPGTEFAGEYVSTLAKAFGFNNAVFVALGTEEQESEVVCSYDPNDKHTFPFGYEEPHYVDPNEAIEYLVRFQNTGNFQAFNVSILDTISEFLDLSTFELVANSHNVQTNINGNTREVEFFFENILLPDSNCCEPESHGFISYRIRPLEELPHDTRIDNTAHIFFDANPAIITNTTWNTLFICDDSFAAFDAQATEVCSNEELSFINEAEYFDSFQWTINGEEVGTDAALNTSLQEAGEYTVELTIENPLCLASQSIDLVVHAYPIIEVSEDQEICVGEEVTLSVSGATNYSWNDLGEEESISVSPEETTTYEVTGINGIDCATTENITVTVLPMPVASFSNNGNLLTASDGTAWQWFWNDDLIDGATNQSYEVLQNGNYSVEVTNEDGCSGTSEQVFVLFVGVTEFSSFELSLFPIPVDGNGILNIAGVKAHELENLGIFDASGRLIWTSAKGVSQVALQGLSSGQYLFKAVYNQQEVKVQFIVE